MNALLAAWRQPPPGVIVATAAQRAARFNEAAQFDAYVGATGRE